jgi:hypothetical protein
MYRLIIFIFSFTIYSIISCSSKPTEPINLEYEGESRPVGPLRVITSKVKSETIFRLNTNRILEKTNYEYYYSNGLLRSKTRLISDLTMQTNTKYYYDNLPNLVKEIVLEGELYSDTILYRFDASHKLVQKETSHTTPNFVLRDTVFYKYDLDGNLIESTKKDPYEEYTKIHREKNEYWNGLLMKTYLYDGDNLIKALEYKYFNEILTERLVYTPDGMLENRYIYYYHDGILRNVKGYFANEQEVSEQKIYMYNHRYELIIQKVYLPSYNSYVDHEIHYRYY